MENSKSRSAKQVNKNKDKKVKNEIKKDEKGKGKGALTYRNNDDDDEDEYETLSDSDTISDSDSDSDDSEDEFSEFITEDCDDDGDDDEESISPQELRKTMANLFPSKYMDKRVKADKKIEKIMDQESKRNKSSKDHKKKSKKNVSESDSDSEARNKRITSKYHTRSKHNKKSSGSDDSDSDSDYKPSKKSKDKKLKSKHNNKDSDDSNSEENSDSDDDTEDDESSQSKKKKQNINIIFGFGPNGQAGDDEEMEDEHALLDEEDCDSDDEKMFMKETYQSIDVPQKISKHAINSKKTKSKSKPKEEEVKEADVSISKTKFNSEYNDLTEMKKYLAESLQKNPKSKMLLKALDGCNQSIKKLVKKERGKNTKEYHKMIHGQDRKFTSEIDYFKKKLSNQEQQRVMKDLKEINEHIQIDKPYRLSLLDSKIPSKYKATVLQKLNILRTMEPGDPEYYKMKNWIDTFMRIPIGVYKSLSVKMSDGQEACQDFMENSIKTLDDCVFGLNDAKMQIIQMIGQWMTNPGSMGTAIAIKGPPGTGKTSIVKEGISKILGREFAFIALGGAGDSSFLEGHSYTYEGSSWGKILQILIDSKCMNPVIYFDELDKLSDSARGVEIASILTHLTDTSQNSEFHDKYFSEMSFDLSKCLFIFSYNDENLVNPILRDRMYRIQTKGYNTKEKITIAKNYMLPKIREQVNFDEGMVIIPDDTLEYIITKPSFTKSEDGVRNLKRCLEIIHTKLNLFRLIKPDNDMFAKEIKLKVEFPFTVTRKEVDALIKEDEPHNQSMLAMYV